MSPIAGEFLCKIINGAGSVVGTFVFWRPDLCLAHDLKHIMDLAGIAGPQANPKGLRHAFGIHAIASKVPLHMLQRWLGHADKKTTAIYAQAVGPEERQIAARMW